jgi:hypothetical protein
VPRRGLEALAPVDAVMALAVRPTIARRRDRRSESASAGWEGPSGGPPPIHGGRDCQMRSGLVPRRFPIGARLAAAAVLIILGLHQKMSAPGRFRKGGRCRSRRAARAAPEGSKRALAAGRRYGVFHGVSIAREGPSTSWMLDFPSRGLRWRAPDDTLRTACRRSSPLTGWRPPPSIRLRIPGHSRWRLARAPRRGMMLTTRSRRASMRSLCHPGVPRVPTLPRDPDPRSSHVPGGPMSLVASRQIP